MLGRTALSVSFAFGLTLAGCGGSYIQRGAELYSDGRYVEAAEVFERTEGRLNAWASDDRAAYAAYRGATFVALGDLEHGKRWLSVAYDIERARPGSLNARQHRFLESAWSSLERQLRSTPPPAPAADTALASSGQAPVSGEEAAPADDLLPSSDPLPHQ
jgi:hypothetical protein